MHSTTRIAVSGMPGSFSHEAGNFYVTGHQLSGVEFIYAVDSAGAFKALKDHQADVCIVPIYNTTGGLVDMTLQAMGQHMFTIKEKFELAIKQCLMISPKMQPEDILRVVSHPQALRQCQQYLQTHWPKRELQEYQDTAKAAKDLHDGKLPPSTAVIAPKLCAELYDLQLLDEAIQDDPNNTTTFLVIFPI